MNLVIGFDPGWGCTAVSIGTETGPRHVEHWGDATWRYHRLQQRLDALDEKVASFESYMGPTDTVRVVVEKPPQVYKRGNQASTGFGLGKLVGAICMWGARPGWLYPWEINIVQKKTQIGWRTHWGLKGKRGIVKVRAVKLAQSLGWSEYFDGCPVQFPGDNKPYPASDRAEAMLIQVAGSKLAHLGPKGPKEWR